MEEFISDNSYLNRTGKRDSSLINRKMIFRVLGVLLLVEMILFLICAAVSWGYGEEETLTFLLTAGINMGVGGALLGMSHGAERKLNRRDGYIIATLAWLLFSFFGMLPFYFSGSVDSVANAFFETMSGFTTTGATIMDNIDSQPHGILFWRSLTNWIGGLGIVFFIIAVLPIFSEGNVQLFSAESIGVTHNKIHPKVSIMAKQLWLVYLILTVSETLLLCLGGMDLFDAVCHAFSTTATGGYSTKQDSVAYWDSPFIEYVVAIFMILSAVNFSLYFLCLRGKGRKMFQDEETRWFLCSILILTLLIAVGLYVGKNYGAEEAFRKALFQVATLHTSTGFATDDYNLWPAYTWVLLIFAMGSGGCTGSTSGGIKSMRFLILVKGVRNHFRRILHPNAVLPIRVNRQAVSPDTVTTVFIFIGLYIFFIFVGWTLLMLMGVGFVESFSTVVSSISNAGPALGAFGPAFSWNALPDAAKWVLSFLMLLGRLEIFCVALLFYPEFWKKR